MAYRAIEMMKTFSNEDVRRFRDFLNSPFFNTSEKLIKLYSILLKYYPEFESKSLSDEKIYEKLNPELKFNKSTVKNLYSDLAEMVEKYLAQINIEKNEIQWNDFLRNEFFLRGLTKCIYHSLKKTEHLFEDTKQIDTDYFINLFWYKSDEYNHAFSTNIKSSITSLLKGVDLIAERAQCTAFIFAKEMIRSYDNIMTYDRNFDIGKDKNFVMKLFKKFDMPAFLNFLATNTDNKTYAGIFELYAAMHNCFTEFDKEEYYYIYKRLLAKNKKFLGNDEMRYHMVHLVRYCLYKIYERKFTEKYEQELFDVYNFILDNGYYRSDMYHYFPAELFRTILYHGLKLKKYKWTLEFINKYKSKLHPDCRKDMYYFACSKYFFQKGKYDEAMKNFHKIQLNHFMLKIDLKNLMLMTYLELGLFENIYSLIDTYRHFLSNDKTLSEKEKKKNRDFIAVVRNLTSYKSSNNSSTLFEIKKIMENELPNTDWIQLKLTELDKKYRKTA